MPNPVTVRYSLQPLADALGLTLDTPGLARRLNLSGTTWKEYRDLGVSERVADRLACKAGLHPYTVWPEMADAHVAAVHHECVECSERFLPRQRNQRYCSKRCKDRRTAREYQRRKYAADPEAKKARVAAYRESIGREAVNADQRRRYRRTHSSHTHRSPSIPHTEGAEVGP
jgi:hypothetical protein